MAVSDSNTPGSAADRALFDYLDGLLHDAREDASVSLDLFSVEEIPAQALAASDNVLPLPTVARTPRPARVVEALKHLAEPRPFAEPVRSLPLRMPPLAAPVEVKPAPPELRLAPVAEKPVEPPAVEASTPVVQQGDEASALAWAANGRPQWAQQPFECLLFTSGGLTLAVPLVELGSIYPLEQEDVTEIFGQVNWFLGLIRTPYGNVRVIDTARVVMPERYQSSMADGYRYVITLNNSDWGLGVDALAGTTLLDPAAVRWRGERSKRPWLAGTVIEKMCALLDAAQLSAMFNGLDRRRG